MLNICILRHALALEAGLCSSGGVDRNAQMSETRMAGQSDAETRVILVQIEIGAMDDQAEGHYDQI